MNRRDFLKFMGAASSATVLSSCGVEKSTEKLIPLLVPAEEGYIPGEAMFQSSTCTECPASCGLSVKIMEYNPIKLEGLDSHPLNRGRLCMRGQASLMRLYHPQRIKAPLVPQTYSLELDKMTGEPFRSITWEDAFKMIAEQLQKASREGRKNVYLSARTTGSLNDFIDRFCRNTGVERLPEFEVFSYANLRMAYQNLFGQNNLPAYQIEKSDFLLTIGADIVETFVSPVSQAMQLQKARENGHFQWVHCEPHASLTGYQANQRLVVKPGSEPALLLYLLNYLHTSKLAKNKLSEAVRSNLPTATLAETSRTTGLSEAHLNELAQKFAEAQHPLLIVGGVSTAQENGLETALLGGLIQWLTGMIGQTVDFDHGYDYERVGSLKDMEAFSQMLGNDSVGVAMLSRIDPAMKAMPESLQLPENFRKASFRVAITDILPEDRETRDAFAKMFDLILPLSHTLESWGDAEPQRGVLNLYKPALRETIFDSRSEGDILLGVEQAAAGKAGDASYREWLQARWAKTFGGDQVEALLEQGFADTARRPKRLSLNSRKLTALLRQASFDTPQLASVLYIAPSVRKYDGRSEDIKLLSEVPDPITTISYGHWVSMSEARAEELNLTNKSLVHKGRDEVEVAAGSATVRLAAMVQPGLAKEVVVIQIEQAPASLLKADPRSGEYLSRIDGVELSKTGRTRPLAIMAGAMEQGKRNIVREDHKHEIPWLKGDETLYPDPAGRYTDYRWAISIDMESCIGCAACVAACYMENNIPCVGETENIRGREMAWIRVEPFYHDDGAMDSLVMMCQQCDFAPCENVCPVYATYHNDEGLNVMVYNRCVGTRYCHNNCPYKVRRFNWWDWTDRGAWQEPMTRMLNPDIWVRPKGVMEKCTFCVQRIRKAKDVAKDENRKVRDGEVIPACAQTCPTGAITFGNFLDENSQVYQKAQSERKYRVLEVLGTGPAIHYLRKEEQA